MSNPTMPDDKIRDEAVATAVADGTDMPEAITVEETTAHSSVRDHELEMYRSLLQPPKEFKNGFTWTTVAGALFCGLLMMPGSIYLSLITGGAINASWVTVIIFTEVSRRALKSLNTQELVVLLYVAGAMATGGPIADLIFRQYFVQSDAVKDIGLFGKFPEWWAPQPTSMAILERNLFHIEWLMPILLILFMAVIAQIQSYTLGYFFFRLSSDVERLPFPFAPIQASGAMALAESGERKQTWKWRAFSIGAIVGLVFATIQIGIPLITGALLTRPIQIIPLPFYDATTATQNFLPATPTGITIDIGIALFGMVMPFWAVMGLTAAVLLTFIMNPLLHKFGVLTRWQPGMDTINTQFCNSVDFWTCFGIGVTLGVALIAFYQMGRDLLRQSRERHRVQKATASGVAKRENIWGTPPAGRGDFSPWVALLMYFACALTVVTLCYFLLPRDNPGSKNIIWFLLFFALLYTPFFTYINTRLIAINGQHVVIPMLAQGAFLLSGYKGVEIWLAPLPLGESYAAQAQSFRVTELTGTNFFSYIKANLVIVPLAFLLSLVFWAFIWHSSAIPSENFPWAQKMWDLQAKQTVLNYSMTLPSGGSQPLFFQALQPNVAGGGVTGGLVVGGGALIFTIIMFSILSIFNLPTMAVYGFITGIGHMPHGLIFIIFGALIGRFYFQKRYGQTQFLQMAPVIVAGYSTGVGLIALIGVAFNLIIKAISPAPF
ncbi:MAG: peptide transporter [Armatimonadota bacterium]